MKKQSTKEMTVTEQKTVNGMENTFRKTEKESSQSKKLSEHELIVRLVDEFFTAGLLSEEEKRKFSFYNSEVNRFVFSPQSFPCFEPEQLEILTANFLQLGQCMKLIVLKRLVRIGENAEKQMKGLLDSRW